MKKFFRVIGVFLLILNILSMFVPAITNATYQYDFSREASWTDRGDGNSGIGGAAENVVGTAITVVKVVGYGISVIMLVYIAIKYMTSAPSDKAEFKKSAVIYLIGALVIFGATKILTAIADFTSKNIG